MGHMRTSLQLHNGPARGPRALGMVPRAVVTTAGVRGGKGGGVGSDGGGAGREGGGAGASQQQQQQPKSNADFKRMLLEGK
jgi:hypothetical protein